MSLVRDGVFVAIGTADRRVVGYDRFRVIERPGRVDVFSRHVVFEGRPVVSYVHQHLDPDWSPRRVALRSDGFAAGFELAEDHARMYVGSDDDGEQLQLDIPVARRRAVVFVTGLLCAPIQLLRRYDASNPVPQEFDLLPSGSCLVRRAGDDAALSPFRSLLDLQVSVSGTDSLMRLILDEHQNLLGYDLDEEQVSIRYQRELALG